MKDLVKSVKPASVGITLDTYSHVLPGLQEAAVERFDEVLALEDKRNDTHVSKALASGEENESEPSGARTRHHLIKSQVLCLLS